MYIFITIKFSNTLAARKTTKTFSNANEYNYYLI